MYPQSTTTLTTTTTTTFQSLPPIRKTKDDNTSIMSINQLCNTDSSDYPDDIKEAAAVLETMKQDVVTTSSTLPIEESTDSSSPPTPLEPSQISPSQAADGFISRMGNIGLVRNAMNAYELGKATSPFIKYTSEMVSSSVSMISRPVIDKIPQLAQLDQYACKGLDKLEEIMDSNNSNNNNDNEIDINDSDNISNGGGTISNNGINCFSGSDNDDYSGESRKRRARRGSSDISNRSRSSSPSYRSPQRIHRSSNELEDMNSSYSTSYSQHYNNHNNHNNHHNHNNNNNNNNNNNIITSNSSIISSTNNNTAAITRSRWQQMLVGAGAAASAAGAAVSEESMKSLKYCLQWLQYATQRIDNQVTILRNFILSMTNPSASRALVPSLASATLSSIKKEVVDTLRMVIEVVSKYAGACLPEQAKITVRTFILELPTRWAQMNHQDHSASPSPMSSPQLSPANFHPLNQTTEYAGRLLSLANESVSTLRSVSGVFSDTVEKAENWVSKLRSVGVTSGGANALGQIHFDSIPQSSYNDNNNNHHHQSSTSSSTSSSTTSSPGSRSRRSSNSARVNGIRKSRKNNK